ncbi:MAG TPA: DUF1599 domain-containing protein [Chitinophagaceae bacterium]|nr:DUF1599 domain-containing protein [Chitinophagaceae bacterium]
MTTNEQYDKAIRSCRDIFYKKTHDYGTAWRVLRSISVADQVYIKAQRIRTIQIKAAQMVEDDITGEFRGMVNYGIIGLIQLEQHAEALEEWPLDMALEAYDQQAAKARNTMLSKNHDYGEAWRNMSQESFVDLILMKLKRVRQILSNEGKTIISEGIDANFIDIINYAVFALILIEEGRHDG